ncbi:hypothetical protein ACPYPG_30975 [Streptomyces sp. FR-108]|uniref:hypothetical protein n=1 Tax=Streptomyces sp. FR-108 TaxID=3416665 RepID=UPI003CF076B5
MGGGARYWNDETQRWEEGGGGSATPTTPPPSRPGYAPPSPSGPWQASSPSASPPPPSADWPGTGEESTWHGPRAHEGSDGIWSPDEPIVGETAFVPGPALAAGGGNRRLVWSVVGGAVVVVVAVALVLTTVVGGGDKPSTAASSSPVSTVSQQSAPYTASESASASASASEEPTVGASASVPELDAGYELYDDQEGFRVGLPVGWSRETAPSQFGIAVVTYDSPDREHRIQVYQVKEATPQASFDEFLSDRVAKAPGFRELDLQPLADGRFTGLRLEYLADSVKNAPDVGIWHVYDARFVVDGGDRFAIAVYGPEANGGTDELELLDTALEGFCPPRVCEPVSLD